MPRLPPALIRQATSENPLLTQLLRVCRDLPSARNELRWLQEHARDAVHAKRYASHAPTPPPPHGDAGVETPKEMAGLSTQTTTLDHAGFENSHRRTKSRKRAQHFRFRKHGAYIAPEEDNSTEIQWMRNLVEEMSSSADNSAQRLPAFRIRYQNHDSDPTEIRPADINNAHASKAKGISKPVTVFKKLSFSEIEPNTRSPNGTGVVKLGQETGNVPSPDRQFQKILVENVEKRSSGMPLQYLIGNQPFGTLEILCRREVLIPRPETEIYTTKVGNLLLSALNSPDMSALHTHQGRKKFRILDLCTGTGCIALLLHSILKPVDPAMPQIPPELDIEILGVDLSPKAINIARKNLELNNSKNLLHPDSYTTVSFQRMDVLDLARKADEGEAPDFGIRKLLNAAAAGVPEENLSQENLTAPWDMVIANPPYISPKDYALGGKTEPSVRDYEPKEALVPVDMGRFLPSGIIVADLFYQPLIRIARAVDAKLLVMEVGGSGQALRVGKQVALDQASEVSARSDKTTPLAFLKSSEVSSKSRKDPLAFSKEAGAQLETWRDDEAVGILPLETPIALEEVFEQGTDSKISDRAVVAWSGPLANWRRRNPPELARKSSEPNLPTATSEKVKAAPKRSKEEIKAARRKVKLDTLAKRQQQGAAGTKVSLKASEKKIPRAMK
ncbi:hypothetical protein H2200_012069 [Cladophialophora chaetospira]|uniref:Methyltransferase domain-containing protein n=1 Tax=Cladophialophora chaetospira TaxID=386627 RepID=A0AA39CCL0_9EURO|nr:hypothetical protein H2200_012069 [Cladophialophora chaetospira]